MEYRSTHYHTAKVKKEVLKGQGNDFGQNYCSDINDYKTSVKRFQ